MDWQEVRIHFPHQWLVVEATQAHSESGKRVLETLTVVTTCENGLDALHQCDELQRRSPEREFYFLHTDREIIDVNERWWLGIRGVR